MLIKPKIINSPCNMQKLCSFNVKNPILGDLQVNTRMEYNSGFRRLFIELTNAQKKVLGREELSIIDEYGKMIGLSIQVEPEYRNNNKRNYHFGEILRLASIIEMIENKKNIFKIFSRDTAIYFHSKYKFEPDITSFEERNHALESISMDNSLGFEDNKATAQKLLEKANSNITTKEQRQLCNQTNALLKEYIKRIQRLGKDEYKLHPFTRGMDMVLTHDRVIRNRAYFNELFKKHGIDYTI